MIDKINTIVQAGLADIAACSDLKTLTEIRNLYLAKKSELMGIFALVKDMSIDDKKQVGQAINQAKETLTQALEAKQTTLQAQAMQLQIDQEKLDITLPGSQENLGATNPFFIVEQAISDIFITLGYRIEEGPEVETDQYNFALLNIPKDHPAREMQDSLYINETTLLRTHTSPVQARAMQAAKGKPLAIICPGKVFRRDEDDATHSHQFGQIEGLMIGEGIHLGHLKKTLDTFAKHMFGEKRNVRLRPSYFPFTEPSVEVDVSCFECSGKGCQLCKQTGWIEILGGGMVHPNVLTMNGYDSETMQGFAFGIGIERVAMLKYGIDDIRRFYQNDQRFLKQFIGL